QQKYDNLNFLPAHSRESQPGSRPSPWHLDSQGAHVEERRRVTAKRKRAKTPLEDFHLRYLWVTDLSAQAWCEQQMVYHRERPDLQLPEREVLLNTGKSIHLVRELQDHDLVDVRTTSQEDRWAIKLLNLLQAIADLREGRRVRECPVFGVLEGVFVLGIVDQLNYTANGELQLNELKTRKKPCLPFPAQKKRDRFQIFLYKYLFDAMVQGCLTQDNFVHHLHLEPKQPLGLQIQEHAQKVGFMVHCFQDLLELMVLNLTHSDIPAIGHLQIEYVHQQTNALIGTEVITYDHDELMAMTHDFLEYWKGQRDPKGVDIEDTWKCCYCAFKDICNWRQQRAGSLTKKCSEKKT
ncbi:exonuclease V, partial [Python bivittatus]|uniref:Exonuclease V n=1 Tax=Python bivittatus TaxID=176946 RepID=A0A9F2R3B2_PYTBI